MTGTIKVFRHGKDTHTRAEWKEGKRRWTIVAAGEGQFIGPTFTSMAEAKEYCEGELCKDRNATFYILLDSVIEETVLDEEFQIGKTGHARLCWSMLSLLIVAALAWLIFVTAAPFESQAINLGLAGGTALLCLVLLWAHNWNVFESMVVMGILLVLALLLTSAIKRKRQRVAARDQPTAVALMPASSGFPAHDIEARAS